MPALDSSVAVKRLAPPSAFKHLALPSLVLAVLYWAILIPPDAATGVSAAGTLSVEQSRALKDQLKEQIRKEQFEPASKSVGMLLAQEPGNHEYIRMAAEIFHGLGRYGDEAKQWEQFLEKAPLPVEACPQIGLAYQKDSRAAEAQHAFERCYDLDPANPDFMLYLALAMEHKGNFMRAAELYASGIQTSPGYLDLHIGLARAQMQMGKLDQASQRILQVLAKDPSNSDALFVAGVTRLRAGDYPGAHRYLDQGARLSPNSEDFRTALNQLKRAEGRL